MEASVDTLEDTSRMTSDVDWTLYTQKPITNFINLWGCFSSRQPPNVSFYEFIPSNVYRHGR
jgi:hypothetical protein